MEHPLTDDERAELRQALQQIQDRTQQIDKVMDRHAPDLARVMVALAELADHRRMLAELVAHAHGGPAPKMTNEAQAVLTRARITRLEK